MSDLPIDLQIVKSSNPGALNDVGQLKSILSGLYPGQSASRVVICTLLQQGFVSQLKSVLANNSGRLPQSELIKLRQTVQDQLGFDSLKAEEALRSWAQVLSSRTAIASEKVDLCSIMDYDASLLSDVKRLNSALSDIFPKDVRGRNTICSLLSNGLVERLKRQAASNSGQVSSNTLEELSRIADAEFGLSERAALEGLGNWCQALEIRVEEQAPTQPLQSVPAWPVAGKSNSTSSGLLTPGRLGRGRSQNSFPNPSLTLRLPNNLTLEMQWCYAGDFAMGSPSGELGSRNREMASHRVTLSQGFYLGQDPVTQEQYLAVMGLNPSRFMASGSSCPVENVDWHQASQFCQKLKSLCGDQLPKGYEFNLPTEAQWEYACRAGTTSALNSGKPLLSAEGACDNLDEVGWYDKNSGSTTHPVGQKKANAWGFFDMHGNVFEWCSDWWEDGQGQEVDPQGPNSGSYRVIRGGSWNYKARNCRSAYRSRREPDNSGSNLGFRLAAVAVKSPF